MNKVLLIEKKNISFHWKWIRKTPFCPLCENYLEEGKKLSWDSESVKGKDRVKSAAEINDWIKSYDPELIDRDVGLGLRLFRDAESSILPMYAIESRINQRQFFYYGRTVELLDAKNSAILEMLERYSSMVPQFKPYIYGSYEDLHEEDYQIIPPEKYILRHEFNPKKKLYWSECQRYGSEESFLIPEQMMYFDNQLLRKEERFIYETSNGTAMGGNIEEALVYAVLEAIERDCFLVHWYIKKLPRLIDPASIKDKNIKQLIHSLENLGYEIHLFDITLETKIPTVWVFASNQREDANLYLYNAAGSHYDPEKAIFAALVEVETSVIVYEEKLEEEKKDLLHLIQNPGEVMQMEDHVNYYSFQENAGAFSYLLDQIEKLEVIRTEEMKPAFSFSFENILKAVSEHHSEIYYTNMSNQLIAEMDLSVVKVFVPSLQPMTFVKQNERINRKRLQDLAGQDSIRIGKEPHPFP